MIEAVAEESATTQSSLRRRASSKACATVVVENVSKSYGELRALDSVSFEVREGEIFGLLGPNGAGKTTTVEIIETLRQPDGGRITVCGFDVATDSREVKQRIGVALQSTALPDKIKPREAMALFASFYSRRADIDKLLRMVSLEEKASSFFDTLSGGQKQRLAVALALANDPELVILDEPTAGLDPQSRRELHEVILRLKEQGKTIILTTHYIEEAERLCDRVAVIDHGRIIALDAPTRLIAASRSHSRIEFTTSSPVSAALLRQIPFVESVAHNGENCTLLASNAAGAVVELIGALQSSRHELMDLHITRPTLEDVFLELTGRRIRD